MAPNGSVEGPSDELGGVDTSYATLASGDPLRSCLPASGGCSETRQDQPAGPRARIEPMKRREGTTPLLSVGHEAEWAVINREEAEQERAINMALTPVQRLEQGLKLSQQAVELLAISIRSGHVPRRALWS
jgi:hypothetical protein